MARITVNTTGTQPVLLVSREIGTEANIANGVLPNVSNCLSVSCLQDITITSSTGVFSWTDFCSIDINKVSTPADNEISTNMVIDDVKYFGNSAGPANSAIVTGVANLSQNKIPVQFKLIWNSSNTSGNAANAYFTSGTGFIASLAPTTSPEAPVWVTPMTIAVNGTMYNGKNP
jgi:hypothetical protein